MREKFAAAAVAGGAELLSKTSMNVAVFGASSAAGRTSVAEGVAEREELGSNVLRCSQT
jgi:hypothetical protein